MLRPYLLDPAQYPYPFQAHAGVCCGWMEVAFQPLSFSAQSVEVLPKSTDLTFSTP